MKRVSKTELFESPPVTLYLDDVEEIIDSFEKGSRVEIRHKDYAYESMEELCDNIAHSSISSLEISASPKEMWGGVSFEIRPDGCKVFSMPESLKLASHIHFLLKKKSPWYSWAPPSIFGGLMKIMLISLANTMGLAFTAFADLQTYHRIFLFGAIIVIFSYVLFSDRVFFGGSKIYLHKRDSMPGFYDRNKDKIILMIITAIVSFLFGYFIK
jgi:hypothetical protein